MDWMKKIWETIFASLLCLFLWRWSYRTAHMTEDSRNHKRRKSNDGVTAAIDQMSTFSINKSKIYTCSECLYPVVVGIGGATRAGKSSLARMLQSHFESPAYPLCQDNFFRNIPYDPLAAEQNWETVHALSFDEMIDSMRKNVDRHTVKCSKHGGSDDNEEELKQAREKPVYVFVEGFLLYQDPAAHQKRSIYTHGYNTGTSAPLLRRSSSAFGSNRVRLLDFFHHKIFLSVSEKACRHRRMTTKRVPESYFDNCLWPGYLIYNRDILMADDVFVLDGEMPQSDILSAVIEYINSNSHTHKHTSLSSSSSSLSSPSFALSSSSSLSKSTEIPKNADDNSNTKTYNLRSSGNNNSADNSNSSKTCLRSSDNTNENSLKNSHGHNNNSNLKNSGGTLNNSSSNSNTLKNSGNSNLKNSSGHHKTRSRSNSQLTLQSRQQMHKILMGNRDLPVAVVGAHTHAGSHVVYQLLRQGYTVKAILPKEESELYQLEKFENFYSYAGSLEIVGVDMSNDQQCFAGITGCHYVVDTHTCSHTLPTNQQELIANQKMNMLKICSQPDSQVKKVFVLSSIPIHNASPADIYDRWGSRNDQEDDAQKRPLDFSEISLAFQQKLQHDMQQFVLTTFYAQQPSVVDIDINVEPNKFSLVFVNSGSLIMGPPVYCNQKVNPLLQNLLTQGSAFPSSLLKSSMSVVDVRSLARVFVLLMQADQPNQQQPLMEFDCVTERVSTAHLIDKLKQYFPRDVSNLPTLESSLISTIKSFMRRSSSDNNLKNSSGSNSGTNSLNSTDDNNSNRDDSNNTACRNDCVKVRTDKEVGWISFQQTLMDSMKYGYLMCSSSKDNN